MGMGENISNDIPEARLLKNVCHPGFEQNPLAIPAGGAEKDI